MEEYEEMRWLFFTMKHPHSWKNIAAACINEKLKVNKKINRLAPPDLPIPKNKNKGKEKRPKTQKKAKNKRLSLL